MNIIHFQWVTLPQFFVKFIKNLSNFQFPPVTSYIRQRQQRSRQQTDRPFFLKLAQRHFLSINRSFNLKKKRMRKRNIKNALKSQLYSNYLNFLRKQMPLSLNYTQQRYATNHGTKWKSILSPSFLHYCGFFFTYSDENCHGQRKHEAHAFHLSSTVFHECCFTNETYF